MNEDSLTAAMFHVRHEIRHSEKMHGPFTHGVTRGIVILTEEVGEAAAEALTLTRPNRNPANTAPWQNRRSALMVELAQVAATAIHMIAKLEEEDYQP